MRQEKGPNSPSESLRKIEKHGASKMTCTYSNCKTFLDCHKTDPMGEDQMPSNQRKAPAYSIGILVDYSALKPSNFNTNVCRKSMKHVCHQNIMFGVLILLPKESQEVSKCYSLHQIQLIKANYYNSHMNLGACSTR